MDRWTLDMSRLTKQRERAAAMQRAALIMAQRASIMCAMAEQRHIDTVAIHGKAARALE